MSLNIKTIRENLKKPTDDLNEKVSVESSNVKTNSKPKDFETLIETIKKRVSDAIDAFDSNKAKTELELLDRLLKTHNLLKTEKPKTLVDKQKQRDELYKELERRISRIAEAKDFENYEKNKTN